MIIEIEAFKFENYIESYKFDERDKYDRKFTGFIKPKEEFEEWFDYIIKFYTKDGIYDNYNEMLDYHITIPSKLFKSGYLGEWDLFVFDFPNEETALYFKLKFNI